MSWEEKVSLEYLLLLSIFAQSTVTGAVHYTAEATPLIQQDLYCN